MCGLTDNAVIPFFTREQLDQRYPAHGISEATWEWKQSKLGSQPRATYAQPMITHLDATAHVIEELASPLPRSRSFEISTSATASRALRGLHGGTYSHSMVMRTLTELEDIVRETELLRISRMAGPPKIEGLSRAEIRTTGLRRSFTQEFTDEL